MNHWKIILVAALTISLAGCVLSGKPKPAPVTAPPQPVTPPPPPEPLSVPQTRVELPPWQPVNEDALIIKRAEAPASESESTKTPAVPGKPAVGGQQHTVTTPAKPPETPPAAPPTEPARQPFQEILPPEELSRLQASALKHRTDTISLRAQALRRGLNTNEKNMLSRIDQFVKQSEDAEKSNDMRSADELAEKAYILAKELQGGK